MGASSLAPSSIWPDAAGDLAGFEACDAAFHDAIAVATHNQTVIAVARTLARVRLQAEWGQLKARSMTPERKVALFGWMQRQDLHQALVAIGVSIMLADVMLALWGGTTY